MHSPNFYRWSVLTAVVLLASCGGGQDDSTRVSTTGSTNNQPTASAIAALGGNESTSFNSANAFVYQPNAAGSASSAASARGNQPARVRVNSAATTAAAQTVDLGAPSAAAMAEFAKATQKHSDGVMRQKRTQLGFSRVVDASTRTKSAAPLLNWEPLSNGQQRATVVLRSPGAAGMRLGLQVQAMPDQARLRVYAQGAQTATEVSGAEVNQLLNSNVAAMGDTPAAHMYWTPSVQGEAVLLELEVSPADKANLSVQLAQAIHMVKDAVKASVEDAQAKASCALNKDATCTPSLAANAVAVMDFVDNGVPLTCTGTLIADRAKSGTPYFLTANHCIKNQAVASTLETTWFWRSAACNSAQLNPNNIKLSGGADFLYGAPEVSPSPGNPVGTDTTLLRLRSAPPAGAVFAGWNTDAQALSTTTNYAGLHHPNRDLLKRSDGLLVKYGIVTTAGVFASTRGTDPMLVIDWAPGKGLTESGSSGSALFLNADTNPQVVGQLWGGATSCTNPNGVDAYGRFDLAYENGLIQWLNAGFSTVFRFYNPAAGAHFYTGSASERNDVRAKLPAFGYEGPTYMVASAPNEGLNPVYRFFNRTTGTHFYTISESERARVQATLSNVFAFEGVAWYARQASSQAAGTIPVFRFFNNRNGTHFYTTSVAERDQVLNTAASVFTYEGEAYRAWPRN